MRQLLRLVPALGLILLPLITVPAAASRSPSLSVINATPSQPLKPDIMRISENQVVMSTEASDATPFVLIAARLNSDGTIDSTYGLAQ
jgi:hypothetical protein